MSAEMVMWLSGVVMLVVVAIVLWNLGRGNDLDRATNALLTVAIIALTLFVWAQHQAERKAEIEHAAEHRAVQEQVESVREF